MRRCYLYCFSMGLVVLLFMSVPVMADQNGLSLTWLREQVERHPKVKAARKGLDAANAMADGNLRPLYNPELETEYERNGDDNNYTIGLNQTIDLWDKRGVRRQQASAMRLAARMNYEQTVQEMMARALRAIVNYEASRDLADFAKKQEEQMNSLLLLVNKRHQAGDIGMADVELAFFNLSQRLSDTAQARAAQRQAEARLAEIVPDWSAEAIKISTDFWQISGHDLSPQELDRLPAVAAARAEFQVMQQQAQLARLTGKVEPTVGLSAGEDGEDNVMAVSLSLPLNFRNNYKAEAHAAGHESAAARQKYLSQKRQGHFASLAALGVMDEYRRYYQRWQGLMDGRATNFDMMLERQWNSGDLDAATYILALGQRTDGMAAGIELRKQYHLACIDWLLATGQLNQQTTLRETE